MRYHVNILKFCLHIFIFDLYGLFVLEFIRFFFIKAVLFYRFLPYEDRLFYIVSCYFTFRYNLLWMLRYIILKASLQPEHIILIEKKEILGIFKVIFSLLYFIIVLISELYHRYSLRQMLTIGGATHTLINIVYSC